MLLFFFSWISASSEKALPEEKFCPKGDITRLSSICPRFECGLATIYGLEPVSVLRSLFESSDLTVPSIKKKFRLLPFFYRNDYGGKIEDRIRIRSAWGQT